MNYTKLTYTLATKRKQSPSHQSTSQCLKKITPLSSPTPLSSCLFLSSLRHDLSPCCLCCFHSHWCVPLFNNVFKWLGMPGWGGVDRHIEVALVVVQCIQVQMMNLCKLWKKHIPYWPQTVPTEYWAVCREFCGALVLNSTIVDYLLFGMAFGFPICYVDNLRIMSSHWKRQKINL